ncbi:hypothetical protein BCR37DRAFT_392326 [Protomyces lactucae-debilis]|uniref:LYR motif-containing protein Cup1-like N-terminal domain-containing protein n=1 Tax=Protomyces lactucae-debilis TaxID=2754530 RepID=A0A1Y2FIV2_PROLT|nr:uncharacterized protein BCR37DRAFT_392326 [Protomyces lactucae-debilis]ORY83881.1 hypothetical protein BCR37DRAFT_392326 [Protomyces lactucae-debilis]
MGTKPVFPSLPVLYRQLLLRVKHFVDPHASKRLLQLVQLTRESARETNIHATVPKSSGVATDRLTRWRQRMMLHCRQLDKAAVGDMKALETVLQRAYGQRGRLRRVYLSVLTDACLPSPLPELIPGYPRTKPPFLSDQLRALLALQFSRSLEPKLPQPAGASAKLQKRMNAQAARKELKAQKAIGGVSKGDLRKLEEEVARATRKKQGAWHIAPSTAATVSALVPPLNPKREANFRWRHLTKLLERTQVPIPAEDRAWLVKVASRQEQLCEGNKVLHGMRIPCWRTHHLEEVKARQEKLRDPVLERFDHNASPLAGVKIIGGSRKARSVAAHVLTDRLLSRLYGRLLAQVPALSPPETATDQHWKAEYHVKEKAYKARIGSLPDEAFGDATSSQLR